MYTPHNILITGGCGFIGSNLVNYLVNKYPDINFINIDKIDYCSSKKNITVNDAPNYKFVKGNLIDEDLVMLILDDNKIDTIIHLAAQSHVDNSFKNALIFIEDNIIATYKLLKCSVEYGGIKRFIHISTDEVYGETELSTDKFCENTILNPTNPYSASKTSAEYFVKSYYKCYDLPIIITRGNNVYGPRQYPEKLIPKFIHQIANNKKCTIHGQGDCVRNFIHVNDVCKALESITFKGTIGQIYNIGTDNEYSVMEITKKIINYFHKNTTDYNQYIDYIEDRPWNDSRYAITNNKLLKLGWVEEIDFEEGFKETIEWYLKHDLKHWT